MGIENNRVNRKEGTRERGVSEIRNKSNMAEVYCACKAIRRERRPEAGDSSRAQALSSS